MKRQISKLGAIIAVLVAATLCTGCNEQNAAAEEAIADGDVPTFDSATDDAPVLAAPPAAQPSTNAEVKVVMPAELPDNMKMSPALQEVAKLVQAGVSEDVILAYATNVSQPFNLAADQIVYLSDLGLSSSVITSLMDHDKSLSVVGKTGPESLPPGLALNTPATNVYPGSQQQPPQVTAPLTPPAYMDEAVVGQPSQPVTTSYFYNTLAPYGSWVQVDGYGLCWQPTVAVANSFWRPYGDRGRWLWSDAGWYWYSDYSWGWAPFHYGRWASAPRVGWVWVPDTVWGPSWVSWRYTHDYCGWAPLPPRTYVTGGGLWYNGAAVSIGFDFGLPFGCWSFLPIGRLTDRDPHRHFVSGSHGLALHRESTVINNYVVGNNNTIINRGVGRDRVARATRASIPTATLVDAPAPKGKGLRAEHLQASGSSLVVTRPRIPVEGSIRKAPARDEVRREHGITPSPAAAKLATISPSQEAGASVTKSPSASAMGSPLVGKAPKASNPVVTKAEPPKTSAWTPTLAPAHNNAPAIPPRRVLANNSATPSTGNLPIPANSVVAPPVKSHRSQPTPSAPTAVHRPVVVPPTVGSQWSSVASAQPAPPRPATPAPMTPSVPVRPYTPPAASGYRPTPAATPTVPHLQPAAPVYRPEPARSYAAPAPAPVAPRVTPSIPSAPAPVQSAPPVHSSSGGRSDQPSGGGGGFGRRGL